MPLLLCGAQGEQQSPLKKNILRGTLEDKSENLLVLRTPEGQDQLFWMEDRWEGIPDRGTQVEVSFSLRKDSQVMTLLSIETI